MDSVGFSNFVVDSRNAIIFLGAVSETLIGQLIM